MPIERLIVDGEAPPFSHYCHVVRAGDHVWLSGMVGMTADGDIPDDTVEQFRLAMATIDNCLRQAGGRPDQVVKVQVFLTDISERGAINPIRQDYFGDHRPASTLLEVSALVDPRLKVEIEAVAYLGA
ncbi:MAG: RidA family protein [Hyphomicrobiaceae bacterium]